jgi:hypothetical protein
MMQVIEGSFTPLPDPVGEIIAFDMVHGWHFQPYVDWEKIGAGAKLYTAAQMCAFSRDVYAKSGGATMASPTPSNLDRIRWAFAEFRKDACVSGDDRVSEAFIKAGLTLLGARADEQAASVLPNAMKLARRTLWLAFVWNDHNFDAAHIEARNACKLCGINSFDEANEFIESMESALAASLGDKP